MQIHTHIWTKYPLISWTRSFWRASKFHPIFTTPASSCQRCCISSRLRLCRGCWSTEHTLSHQGLCPEDRLCHQAGRTKMENVGNSIGIWVGKRMFGQFSMKKILPDLKMSVISWRGFNPFLKIIKLLSIFIFQGYYSCLMLCLITFYMEKFK